MAKKDNNKNVNRQKIYNKFGSDVLHMIIFAKAASINAKIDCIYPESFIIAILSTGENQITSILSEYNIDLAQCLKHFKNLLHNYKKEDESFDSELQELKISKQVSEICQHAYEYSNKINAQTVTISHIFLSALKITPELKKIFQLACKDKDISILNKALEDIQNDKKIKHLVESGPAKSQNKTSMLNQFCINMTEMAKNNKYDPIIARDNEIEEIITILCRRTKSNPLLIGQPGVGKSAIVEGIAQRIISNTVPKKLMGCKIFNLNMSSMVAGTKYRGEFEERMQILLKEIEDNPQIIIFIDEIHTILGAGSSSSSGLDAANILKPALARSLKCIGATTYEEYKKYFCEDGALMRRFGTIMVEEPNEEQTKMILCGLKEKLETYHDCIITDDAIDTTIKLCKRYRTDKNFPDKAIDCIDIACAKYSWKHENGKKQSITSNDIALVISKQCSIPLEIILWDSYERIKKTEEILAKNIIGQTKAIESICRILKNAYSGVRNPNRPIGTMVFGGPSGTGKTYTGKQLANTIFGNESAFIRLDMTEYTEQHSVSKIIGSPPGYVGFKDIDIIADRIRRKPYCVLLLDEIEKAHPIVVKIFLQVMGDGVLTTASGEKIDCKNVIIIMTGNFNINNFEERPRLGFNSIKENINNNEIQKNKVIDYCRDNFGIEFINRVDDFIYFNDLTEENLKDVAKLKLKEFSERINNKKIQIIFNDSVADRIIELGKDEHGTNAMAIERIISKNIEPCIADGLLSIKEQNKEHTIEVEIKDNEFSLKIDK